MTVLREAAAVGHKPNSVPRLRRATAADLGAVTIIPLAPPLLAGSSSLPGSFGRTVLWRFPIWPCSVRGFACHPCCHERGALLPHLFTLTFDSALRASLRASLMSQACCRAPGPTAPGACRERGPKGRVERRYIFCATFLQVALTGRYPAHCPAEFGLSSPRLASTRLARWQAHVGLS